jgi:hypothetical protein
MSSAAHSPPPLAAVGDEPGSHAMHPVGSMYEHMA